MEVIAVFCQDKVVKPFQSFFDFPHNVRSIILVEFMERYAYYAFRAILTIYFISELKLKPSTAMSMFMYTSSLAYFTPMIGGLLSDGLLGKYRTIVIFCSIYIAGLFCLALGAVSVSTSLSVLGLVLIGIGTGGIKPCVSSFGADQISKPSSSSAGDDTDTTTRRYFSAFYFSINLGALLSFVLSPVVKRWFGFGVAFFIPALFMLLALVVLVKGRTTYIIHMPRSTGSAGLLTSSPVGLMIRVVYRSISHLLRSVLGIPHPQSPSSRGSFPDIEVAELGSSSTSSSRSRPPSSSSSSSSSTSPSSSSYPSSSFLLRALGDGITESDVSAVSDFFRVWRFLLLMPIFWMLYDQQGAAWVLQSQRMRLPDYMEAEQLGVLNTIFVLALLPMFENGLYPFLKRKGFEVTQLSRMSVGMLLGGVAFLMSGLLEMAIIKSKNEHGVSDISAFWQTPQYLVLTIAELGVSTTGLEFFYVEAPPSMRTAASALFLLTTAVGDLLGGFLYDVCGAYGVADDTVMLFCGALLGCVAVIFARCAATYKYRAQDDSVKKRSCCDEEDEEVVDDERIRLNA